MTAKRLGALAVRLRMLLGGGDDRGDAAVEYVVETVLAELEQANAAEDEEEGNEGEGEDEEGAPGKGGSGIRGPEDVFSVLQASGVCMLIRSSGRALALFFFVLTKPGSH